MPYRRSQPSRSSKKHLHLFPLVLPPSAVSPYISAFKRLSFDLSFIAQNELVRRSLQTPMVSKIYKRLLVSWTESMIGASPSEKWSSCVCACVCACLLRRTMMALIVSRSIISSVEYKHHNMQTSGAGQRSVQPRINIRSLSPPPSLSVCLSYKRLSVCTSSSLLVQSSTCPSSFSFFLFLPAFPLSFTPSLIASLFLPFIPEFIAIFLSICVSLASLARCFFA